MIWPIADAREVLKFYADYCASAPDDPYLDFIMAAPPGAAAQVAIIHACYSGPKERADAVLAPVTGFGKPLVNQVAAVDYVGLQRSGDDSDPRSGGEYLKSGFNDGISDDLINAMVGGFEPHNDRATIAFFQQSGAAISRVPSDATAFAHRWASHSVFTVVAWNPAVDREPHIRYLRNWWNEVEPSTQGFYTNEVADEAHRIIAENYEGNFDRLLAVKNRYDPSNLFRLNANIPPTAKTG